MPHASACSLAYAPKWLDFVLNRGLAKLNPDCTLTWATGDVTDLSGNTLSTDAWPEPGLILFLLGAAMFTVGILLMAKLFEDAQYGELKRGFQSTRARQRYILTVS